MRTFNANYATAIGKKANAPVTLMKIEWPAAGALPALTLRLADRGDGGAEETLTIGGEVYRALVVDWGDIDRLGTASEMFANAISDLRVAFVNTPTDLFSPPGAFSEIFAERPPETATVTIYRWMDGEGLTAGEKEELFVGRFTDPKTYTPLRCTLGLTDTSEELEKRRVGDLISLVDFPFAPESSVGKMVPIPFGQVKNSPGIPVRVALITVLTASVLAGGATLQVKSTEGFATSGQLVVGDDTVSYTGKTDTTFTGVTGLTTIYYADEEVFEKITSWRYIFANPRWPIQSIFNVRVGGQKEDAANYTVNILTGEVAFMSRPRKVSSVDSLFLAMQFDAVTVSNSALNALNATDPQAKTSLAELNQVNSTLALLQTDDQADLGDITSVRLMVEHFEENMPNDFLEVWVGGIGVVGTLSPPNAVDEIETTGEVDYVLSHVENLGIDISESISHSGNLAFPTVESPHLHGATTTSYNDLDQEAADYAFPTFGVNILTGETFGFNWAAFGNSALIDQVVYQMRGFSINTTTIGVVPLDARIDLMLDGVVFWSHFPANPAADVLVTELIITSAQVVPPLTNVVSATHTGFDGTLAAATFSPPFSNVPSRALQYDTTVATVDKLTGIITQATGAVDNHALNVVEGTTGNINDHSGTSTLEVATGSAKRTVIDRFDITNTVNGDWNWFKNREARVQYQGTQDGATAYVAHMQFEIEHTVKKYEYSDEITADIDGVKDDASGTVTGTANQLIERPDHLFKWSLLKYLGFTSSVIDSTSFDASGTALDGEISGGYKFCGVLLTRQEMGAIWAAWDRQARTYFSFNRGKAYLRFRPLNDVSTIGAPVKSIVANQVPENSIKITREKNSNLINQILMSYDLDPAESEFRALEIGSDAVSVATYGTREPVNRVLPSVMRPLDGSKIFEFDWVTSRDMALSLIDFYLKEYAKPHEQVEFLAFLDNSDIEEGDIINLTLNFHGISSAPALVLGVAHELGSGLANKMDAVRLRVRLFPVEVERVTLTDSMAVSDSASFDLNSILEETVDISDFGFATFEETFQESVALAESVDEDLRFVFLESVALADVPVLAHGALFQESLALAENPIVPGKSGGYGVQPYSLSGYGGWEDIDDPTFRIGLVEPVAVSDQVENIKYDYSESLGMGEFAYTANAGYGLSLYSLEGYGGREVVANG